MLNRDVPVLANDFVRLEPLTIEHAPALLAAYEPGTLDLMAYYGDDPVSATAMTAYVEYYLALRDSGAWVPFVVRDARHTAVVGFTSFLHPEDEVPSVEIGSTWYAPTCRGTYINPAAKRLLLAHAFDDWRCEAVALLTSHRNTRSQAAIRALGAHLDGVLRAHKRQSNGELRDTHWFSIVRAEWPEVRTRLDARLDAYVA